VVGRLARRRRQPSVRDDRFPPPCAVCTSILADRLLAVTLGG
jgi:hypothetical protein